ncbi:MAG TPA: discoidin domain-containing protein, partial [Armatimonadota bacterium]|nr:discoidin domain-containing protein [Armatimonadota bacterium]
PMRGELIDLFDEYDVAAVFTGHTHHRISNYLRGTKYLTLPSTTFARNFGGSYGLPGLKVVWDPERVGYYVVRVYGKESRINLVRTYAPLPPLETLQEGNESPRMRAIGLKSAEIEADDFGVLSAPPPKVDRSIWNTMGAVDGVKPSDCKPELVPAHCWTSNVHAFDDQHDWLTVTLPAAKQIDRVIYYPRPGNFGWPLDFTISISADGETWETVVKRENFKAPVDATETGIEFSLEGTRSVMAVKMDMLRISATDHTNIRTAMMEVVLPDGQGGDCALEALGAVAASGTKVGGDRKTVDDHFFAEPTQAGAKWAVLPGDTLSRETVELAKGKLVLPAHVRRAFTLGRPPGLRFVIPITRAGPLHATSSADEAMEAFRDYVAFMGRECPKGSAWRFVIPEGHVPVPPVDDAIAAALIDLRRADSAASIVLELADASMAQDWATGRFGKAWAKACDGLMVPVTAGGRPETELAEVLNGLGDEPALPVWLTLDGWKSAEFDDITRAKLLARSMVWARAEGIGLIWWAAPGEPGGLLNSVATPEATMYAYRSVATLLSGAEPLDLKEIGTIAGETDKVEARAFRAVDGSRLVALWQPAEPGATAEPATIRIRPTGQAGTPVAVDCLTCTLQELNVEGQGGQSTIEGLQIRDWPIIVRMDG